MLKKTVLLSARRAPLRWYHTALALVVILCFAAGLHAEEAIADSAENFIKDWVAVFNKNDPEKLLTFYDPSNKTEVIVSSGFHYRGYKAVQKVYRDDLNQVRVYDSSAKEMGTRILGDMAIVTFEHLFKFRSLADDSRWQVHIRTTSVLHRVENKWKIVHEHSSSIHGVKRMTRIKD
ncbi:MAG: nuclear transport factor 2 family protein [Candidatus Aminicenantes bacterium]|jgi:ketosteroid isomerase-like protein